MSSVKAHAHVQVSSVNPHARHQVKLDQDEELLDVVEDDTLAALQELPDLATLCTTNEQVQDGVHVMMDSASVLHTSLLILNGEVSNLLQPWRRIQCIHETSIAGCHDDSCEVQANLHGHAVITFVS